MKKFTIKKLTVGVMSVGIAVSVIQPQIPSLNITSNVAYGSMAALPNYYKNDIEPKEDDNVVVDLDINLKRYINEAFSFNTDLDSDLTRGDLRKITAIYIPIDNNSSTTNGINKKYNISSLKGLEFAENLSWIYINSYRSGDDGSRANLSISPLLGLKNLSKLSIDPKEVIDFENITKIENLSSLEIYENERTNDNYDSVNYDVIANIKNLRSIEINTDKSDINFLNNLDIKKFEKIVFPGNVNDIANIPFWDDLTYVKDVTIPRALENKKPTFKVSSREFYLPFNYSYDSFDNYSDILKYYESGRYRIYRINDSITRGNFRIELPIKFSTDKKIFNLDVDIKDDFLDIDPELKKEIHRALEYDDRYKYKYREGFVDSTSNISINNLENLENITIENSNVSNIEPLLKYAKNLKKISIRSSNIDADSIAKLNKTNFKNLEKLYVKTNKHIKDLSIFNDIKEVDFEINLSEITEDKDSFEFSVEDIVGLDGKPINYTFTDSEYRDIIIEKKDNNKYVLRKKDKNRHLYDMYLNKESADLIYRYNSNDEKERDIYIWKTIKAEYIPTDYKDFFIDDKYVKKASSDNEIVNLDKNLKQYLNEFIYRRNKEQDITKYDLKKLIYLPIITNRNSKDISNISGLEFAENLHKFSFLARSDIFIPKKIDISPLLNLKSLENLSLSSNYVDNLKNISKIENLRALYIEEDSRTDNEYKDYSFLGSLKKLERLGMGGVQFQDYSDKDLNFIENLKKLRFLGLPRTKYDITHYPKLLDNITNIESINFHNENIPNEPFTLKVNSKNFYLNFINNLPVEIDEKAFAKVSDDKHDGEYRVLDGVPNGIYKASLTKYGKKIDFYLDVNISPDSDSESNTNTESNGATSENTTTPNKTVKPDNNTNTGNESTGTEENNSSDAENNTSTESNGATSENTTTPNETVKPDNNTNTGTESTGTEENNPSDSENNTNTESNGATSENTTTPNETVKPDNNTNTGTESTETEENKPSDVENNTNTESNGATSENTTIPNETVKPDNNTNTGNESTGTEENNPSDSENNTNTESTGATSENTTIPNETVKPDNNTNTGNESTGTEENNPSDAENNTTANTNEETPKINVIPNETILENSNATSEFNSIKELDTVRLEKSLDNNKVFVEFSNKDNINYELEVKDVTNELKDFVKEKINKENVDIEIFDFNLINSDTKEVVNSDVDRTVKIVITKDLTNKNVEVYYLNEKENKLELLESTLDGNIVEFKTNHFSKYAVVLKDKVSDNSKKLSQDRILPKTSAVKNSNNIFGAMLLAISTLLTALNIRRRKNSK